MISLNGSYGEGGGQILRTALTLSMITGTPIEIYNIRAGRKKPGLSAQHLTCIQAAATICNADVRGNKLGSQMLEFRPNHGAKFGDYVFDVTDTAQGGSAGAVTLILQTILLPLALADGDSQIILKGGTHVAFSPPVNYIQDVYFPQIKKMGIDANLHLKSFGWYPKGGGEITVKISGKSTINGMTLLDRGRLKQIKGIAVVTNLESHISQRMVNRAKNLLTAAFSSQISSLDNSMNKLEAYSTLLAQLRTNIKPVRGNGNHPGAGFFLTVEYEKTLRSLNSIASFSGLGKLGLPAEEVAKIACDQFLAFHDSYSPVDEHLADQLLLPAALSSDDSFYKVAVISEHLRTNAWVIQQFNLKEIIIDEKENIVKVRSSLSSVG